jgi:hypothetical protein
MEMILRFIRNLLLPNFNRPLSAYIRVRKHKWEIERIAAYGKSLEDGVKCDKEMMEELKKWR